MAKREPVVYNKSTEAFERLKSNAYGPYGYEEIETGGGGSTDLQGAIDAGAVLNKVNTIDLDVHGITIKGSTSQFLTIIGDFEYTNKLTEWYQTENVAHLYAQSDAAANTLQLEITPTTATISKDGGTAKEIAAISASDDFADDAAAATGGIAVGQLYHTAGAVKIRLA